MAANLSVLAALDEELRDLLSSCPAIAGIAADCWFSAARRELCRLEFGALEVEELLETRLRALAAELGISPCPPLRAWRV